MVEKDAGGATLEFLITASLSISPVIYAYSGVSGERSESPPPVWRTQTFNPINTLKNYMI